MSKIEKVVEGNGFLDGIRLLFLPDVKGVVEGGLHVVKGVVVGLYKQLRVRDRRGRRRSHKLGPVAKVNRYLGVRG
jgi:hypothetical protein